MSPAATPLNEAARRRHKWRNRFHSALLLGGMVGLLALCAALLLGVDLVPWVLAGAALALAFSPGVSPRLVLAMYRARPLRAAEFPDGIRLLRAIADRAGLRHPPALHYVPSGMVNAFAVGGPQDAAIAVTDGMIRALSLRELAGVLAHEISHIRNNDLWVMNLADAVSRLTATMAYIGVLLCFLFLPLWLIGVVDIPFLLLPVLILAPTVGGLLQLALSRSREFDADLDAAGLTGDPRGLASALARIERIQAGAWERLVLPGARIPEPSLLRTHPGTDERIQRLLAVDRPDAGRRLQIEDDAPSRLPGGFPPIAPAPRRRWTGLWY